MLRKESPFKVKEEENAKNGEISKVKVEFYPLRETFKVTRRSI